MKNLLVLFTIAMAMVLAAAEQPAGQTVLRGKIVQRPDQAPVIQTADGKRYTVAGDDFTKSQMKDEKLNGREIELEGRFSGTNNFDAAKIFTIKNGKRYVVTYWCEICSIRTHMAGRCMCCQGETELQELPEGQDRPSL